MILNQWVLSQRIVLNNLLIDIDDCNQVDTDISKNNFSTLNLYLCSSDNGNKDSCVLIWRKKYDKSGQMIEQIKGENLTANRIDFAVRYKKISDALFESILKYPYGSLQIPQNLFRDSVIYGKAIKVGLYKTDNENNIVIRSEYHINSQKEIEVINRYNTAGKLIEIWYPSSNQIPIKEKIDTAVNEYGTIYNYDAEFKDTRVRRIDKYNKNGEISENITYDVGLNIENRGFCQTRFIYDDKGKLVIEIATDENSKLISEKKYYYNKDHLDRYTVDFDISDDYFNEEKRFNDFGNMIYFQQRELNGSNNHIWRYLTDDRGLILQRDFYNNDKLISTLQYKYE
jgi:hypothetical protein